MSYNCFFFIFCLFLCPTAGPKPFFSTATTLGLARCQANPLQMRSSLPVISSLVCLAGRSPAPTKWLCEPTLVSSSGPLPFQSGALCPDIGDVLLRAQHGVPDSIHPAYT